MKLLLKIKTWIIKTFTSVKKELKTIIPIAITIVNGIKTFVDSEGANFLTSIIPGELDNNIKTFLRASLPGILNGLHKWESIINVEDIDEQLKLIAVEMALLTKSERDNMKTQIAAEIVTALAFNSDIDVTNNDAFIMVKTSYIYPEILKDEKAI